MSKIIIPATSAQDDNNIIRNSFCRDARPSPHCHSERGTSFRVEESLSREWVCNEVEVGTRGVPYFVIGIKFRNRYRANCRPAIGYGDPSTSLRSAQDDKKKFAIASVGAHGPPHIVILSEELRSASKNLFRGKGCATRPQSERAKYPFVSGGKTRNSILEILRLRFAPLRVTRILSRSVFVRTTASYCHSEQGMVVGARQTNRATRVVTEVGFSMPLAAAEKEEKV